MEKELEKHRENLRLTADLGGSHLIAKAHEAEKGIGIFYAPSGGSVHKVAWLIKQRLAGQYPEMHCITDIAAGDLLDYRNLILVCSTLGRNTWETEQSDAWSSFLPKVLQLRLDGRRVAVVALGDHVSYPNNFVDGMVAVADVVEEAGGRLIGATATVDYIFNDSRALRGGKFVGLPLDEDYENVRTEARIEGWVEQIWGEMEKMEKTGRFPCES